MSDDEIMKAVDPFWRGRTNDPVVTIPLEQWEKLRARVAELEAERDRYYELLYAVEKKHPGETRHETALRHIKQAEAQTGDAGQASREDAPR